MNDLFDCDRDGLLNRHLAHCAAEPVSSGGFGCRDIKEQLAEEQGGDSPHPELWPRFLQSSMLEGILVPSETSALIGDGADALTLSLNLTMEPLPKLLWLMWKLQHPGYEGARSVLCDRLQTAIERRFATAEKCFDRAVAVSLDGSTLWPAGKVIVRWEVGKHFVTLSGDNTMHCREEKIFLDFNSAIRLGSGCQQEIEDFRAGEASWKMGIHIAEDPVEIYTASEYLPESLRDVRG